MTVIFNGVEMFDFKGSGIKYFSRSLLAAARRSGIDSALLLQTKGSGAESVLARSTLFQLHQPQGSRAAKIQLQLQERLLAPFRLRPPRLKAVPIPAGDPLQSIALKRLPGTGREPRFLAGQRLFFTARQRFALNGSFTALKVPQAGALLHNPLPYPLLLEGGATITTVHDLIPLTHPEVCLDKPEEFHRLISRVLRHSAAIHAISKYTADTLMEIYGAGLRDRIHVIPQPAPVPLVAPGQRQQLVEEHLAVWDRLHREGEGYLLQLGSIEPKKNHDTTVQAFRELRRRYPDLQLVVVGKRGWLCEEICETLSKGRRQGIVWLGSVPRSTVEHLLRGALALVFPSLVEGWGLPPQEAMAMGTPAVVADIPPCREACGDAALFVDPPTDVTRLRDAVLHLLGDRDRYGEIVQRSLVQASVHDPEQFGTAMAGFYRRLGA
ncbi:MAG: glycosyltransferase family 4 protein [Cyanobacteriota bacterium]|jgi:glycosyltransferase involved in cell wall biosynthesis